MSKSEQSIRGHPLPLSFAAMNVGMAVLRLLDPEQAHDVAIWAAAHGLLPRVSKESIA